MLNRLNSKNGSILIFALWALTLLSFFAATIGLIIRQRLTLMSRLEKRAELRHIADAGVKTAISALRLNMYQNGNGFNNMTKSFRHNNESMFKDKLWGQGMYSVQHPFYDKAISEIGGRYGLADEESKININTADRSTLVRLFIAVYTADDGQAQALADAILDWREFGRANSSGFYSDDFYYSLEYPYEPKNENFEIIDELKLVQGITEEVYNVIIPFVTIYGDGMVNVNTASKPVLIALGLDSEVADKILSVRSGKDGIDATEDDFVFIRPYDVAADLVNSIKLDNKEILQVDHLNQPPKIKTNSEVYFINSVAKLNNGNFMVKVQCVFNAADNRIEYWREKN